jgi:hypothetical protein
VDLPVADAHARARHIEQLCSARIVRGCGET